MEKLFVYGTLKDAEVQRAVIDRVVEGVESELEGFELTSIQLGRKRYPMVRQNSEQRVTGIVLQVTADELLHLDAYETDAYARVRVSLATGGEAWVYCEP